MISRVSGHAYPAGHCATQVASTLKNDAEELSLRECDAGTSTRAKIYGLDTKSVGWWKIRRSPTVVCHFDGSLANAFLTSAKETPNCRAILDGVTPALTAARTAFSFPSVKLVGTSLVRCLREVSIVTGSVLPRRCCSAITAASSRSS